MLSLCHGFEVRAEVHEANVAASIKARVDHVQGEGRPVDRKAYRTGSMAESAAAAGLEEARIRLPVGRQAQAVSWPGIRFTRSRAERGRRERVFDSVRRANPAGGAGPTLPRSGEGRTSSSACSNRRPSRRPGRPSWPPGDRPPNGRWPIAPCRRAIRSPRSTG